MRVAEQRNPVRRKPNDLIDRVRKGLRRLIRKSVNQVHVDTVEAETARSLNQIPRHFIRLDAIDRALYRLMKILNTHALAVETEPSQRFQMFPRSHARI